MQKVFLQKSAVIITQIFSPSVFASLCGLALIITQLCGNGKSFLKKLSTVFYPCNALLFVAVVLE